MKSETMLLILGAAAAAGAGYYFFVYKPAQLAPGKNGAGTNPSTSGGGSALPAPTGQVQGLQSMPQVSQLPQIPPGLQTSLQSLPPLPTNLAGLPKTPVTLTVPVSAWNIVTMAAVGFNPGQTVYVIGTPIPTPNGNITTFLDSAGPNPTPYATITTVA